VAVSARNNLGYDLQPHTSIDVVGAIPAANSIQCPAAANNLIPGPLNTLDRFHRPRSVDIFDHAKFSPLARFSEVQDIADRPVVPTLPAVDTFTSPSHGPRLIISPRGSQRGALRSKMLAPARRPSGPQFRQARHQGRFVAHQFACALFRGPPCRV